jgi:hypothetical protein
VDEEHDVANYDKHSAPQHEMCAILERAVLTLDVKSANSSTLFDSVK